MSLDATCIALLRANDRGRHTIPSPHLYPHQWNWDSAFAALGWAWFDPGRALSELERLLEAQWPDGNVPHIRFAEGPEAYAPGPDFWGTEDLAPPRSSITQPPIAAIAALKVLERGGDPDRVRALLPALDRWHGWLLGARDPAGHGAVALVHPWESGMDNAPRWDEALMRWEPGEVSFTRVDTERADPDERPHDSEYRRYAHLVDVVRRCGFDQVLACERSPFLVEDVAITGMLGWAEECLAELGERLGVATAAAERLGRLEAGLEHLWTDEGFRDFDLRAGAHVAVRGAWELVPLVAPLSPERAAAVVARLGIYDAPCPLPTVPLGDPCYEARRYWRGPMWVSVNWLVVRGLQRHGYGGEARALAAATLEAVEAGGPREHYRSDTGAPGGAKDFTWSAALALDLLRDPV